MIKINVEELHAKWLDEMVEFAWQYMVDKHGPVSCQAHILELASEEEFVFESKGVFDLPPGAGLLCLFMARFARCTFTPDRLVGLSVEELPEAMFCLNNLLQAAFPRNVSTGVFKAHDGAVGVGAVDDPEFRHRFPHVAFAGIGILMMQNVRRILSPLATDADVVKLTDGKFLAIIEDS